MVTKTAKTIPGKWGQEQLIRMHKSKDKDDKRAKKLEKLLAEGKLEAGKHFEKLYEKVWEKQEKGEHYATSTNGSTKKNYKNNYKKKLIYV
tara:strand:- start:220 stop:492 length:273 start_codon:yes stop_codon:yes gene_type:complete